MYVEKLANLLKNKNVPEMMCSVADKKDNLLAGTAEVVMICNLKKNGLYA